MKFKRLSAAALIAAIGAMTVAPLATGATAQTHDVTSEGTVDVKQGTIDPTTDAIPDPEVPANAIFPDATELVLSTVATDQTIGMVGATQLRFPEINTGNKAQSVNAPAFTGTLMNREDNTDAGTPVTRGNFITWSDIRASGNAGYTISAQMTSPFTSSSTTNSKVMSAAEIRYTNPIVGTLDNNAATPAPNVSAATFNLSYDAQGTATPIVVAEEATTGDLTGRGSWTLAWGSTNGSADTSGNSVSLYVPTGAGLVEDTYTAEITWTLGYNA
ncbi:WxL domain-containing protein [Enterococcus sp. LJL90]